MPLFRRCWYIVRKYNLEHFRDRNKLGCATKCIKCIWKFATINVFKILYFKNHVKPTWILIWLLHYLLRKEYDKPFIILTFLFSVDSFKIAILIKLTKVDMGEQMLFLFQLTCLFWKLMNLPCFKEIRWKCVYASFYSSKINVYLPHSIYLTHYWWCYNNDCLYIACITVANCVCI